MVRGIVLALREEEGLKALIQGQPAAMARVCGRPAAEYAVDLLAKAGVRRGMILTRENCDAAQARFDGAVRDGVALRVVRTGENAPAPAIRRTCSGRDTLAVLDGAALCAFDLREALRCHRERRADATLILVPHRAPDSGAGCPAACILSPRASAALPSAGPLDHALLDFLSGLGMRTGELAVEGFALPIRDEEEFRRCQREILCGTGEKWGVCPGPRDAQGNIIQSRLPSGCLVTPPVFVGRGVSVGRDTDLESGTVLDDYSAVGSGARLRAAVLLPGASAADGARLSNVILCPGQEKGDILPAWELLRTGQALGAVCRGRTVALGHDGDPLSRARALILCGALTSAGAVVLDFGHCSWGAYLAAWKGRSGEAGAYLSAQVTGGLRLTAPGGLPLTGRMHRDLLDLLSAGWLPAAPASALGNRRVMEDPVNAYAQAVRAMASQSLWGTRCRVICPDRELQHLAGNLLSQLGCRPGGDRLILDPLGERAELFCQDGRRFSWDDILTLLGADKLACGADVAVPREAAASLERIAEEVGGRVLRYAPDPCEGRDAAARSLAREQLWVRDGLMAGVALLSLMHQETFLLTAVPLSKYNKTIVDNLCKLH